MSEIESWMVPQSERQLAERHDNELRAAIRAALEAAAKLIEYGIVRTKTPTYEGPNIFRLPSIIRSLSPDDILKRL